MHLVGVRMSCSVALANKVLVIGPFGARTVEILKIFVGKSALNADLLMR